MANLQYVGARYVPKFFENPNGSAEWLSGIPYEALTVVTYLGNSYTSKIPVPVGVEITNTDYWVATGIYNEQLGSLLEKWNNQGQVLVNLADLTSMSDLQAMIDQNQNIKLLVPNGYTFNIGTITLSHGNVSFEGDGTIIGSIVSNQTQWERLSNIRFSGITFQSNSSNPLSGSETAIMLQFMENIHIENCTFKDYAYAIYIPEFEQNAFQHVRNLSITNCNFNNVGYAIYTQDKDMQLQVGDSYFVNNTVSARFEGLHLCNIDGINVSKNTFFFPSYESKDPYKTNSIYISNLNWGLIEGNNFFEAGYCGLLLNKIRNTIVSGNNIAWCGQRTQSDGDGIRITNTANDNTSCRYNSIMNNNISIPSGNGINIVSCANSSFIGNNVEEPSRNPAYYYGNIAFQANAYNGIVGSGNTLAIIGNRTSGGRINGIAGSFIACNLDSTGMTTGYNVKEYSLITGNGNYVTAITENKVIAVSVVATTYSLGFPVIAFRSGQKEVAIQKPDGSNFEAGHEYKVVVLESLLP